MGVNIDESTANMTSGVYTFRVHGSVYHRIDQLVSTDGTPRYLQLYFYDAEAELNYRLHGRPNLDRDTAEIISGALANNPYVHIFKRLGTLENLENYRVGLNCSVEVDQRRYNKPRTDEVCAISSCIC